MSTTAAVPAWKRLGLKLKQPAGAAPPAATEPTVGQPAGAQSSKRKLDAPPSLASPKRPRRESQGAKDDNSKKNVSLKPKKSVTFGDTPTKNGSSNDDAAAAADDSAAGTTSPAKKQKKQGNKAKTKSAAQPNKPKQKSQSQPPAVTDIKPALEYLRHWKTSRETWKFNKNHQSALIKHFFEPKGFPSSDTEAFYDYIQDLKGFVRTRLRETAMEVRMQDEAAGAAGFQDSDMEIDDDDQQKVYEAILTEFFRSHLTGKKRKYYNEAQWIANSKDGDAIINRVVKRMRAEMLLDELSDGETTDAASSTTSKMVATEENTGTNTTNSTDGEKRMRLNDGSGKRRRKLRVNDVESSSSESESDSDSDTSSSGSSDESDDDEEEVDSRADDSSSSSSSSSEDSDDEDDSDGDE